MILAFCFHPKSRTDQGLCSWSKISRESCVGLQTSWHSHSHTGHQGHFTCTRHFYGTLSARTAFMMKYARLSFPAEIDSLSTPRMALRVLLFNGMGSNCLSVSCSVSFKPEVSSESQSPYRHFLGLFSAEQA